MRACCLLCLWLAAGAALPCSAQPRPTPDSADVLILLPDQPGRTFTNRILAGFRNVLETQAEPAVNVFAEYSGAYADETGEVDSARRNWVRAKSRSRQFRTVVAIGYPSVELVRSLRAEVFPDAYVVYAVADFEKRPAALERSSGIILVINPHESFELARRLMPEARYAVLWGGVTELDRNFSQSLLARLGKQYNGLDIIDWTGEPVVEFRKRLINLRGDGFVFMLSEFADRNGRLLDARQTMAAIGPVSPLPIFGVSDLTMGEGLAGGSLISWINVGADLARITLSALRGEIKADTPPNLKNHIQTPVVDWRQLKRYGIPESRIPPGARVRYKPAPLWRDHAGTVTAAAAAIALQGILIGILLLERRRRLRSQALARAMLSSVPGYVVMIDPGGKILRTNQQFSHPHSEFEKSMARLSKGANYFDALQGLTAFEPVSTAVHGLASGEIPDLVMEQFQSDPSGGTWFEIRGEHLGLEPGGAVVAHLDITARKRAEAQSTAEREALSHLDRVASLGLLAASLAHELNQPLTGMLSNAEAAEQLLSRTPPDLTEAREAVRDIASENRRATSIINKMRQLLRKQQTTLLPVNLNHAVRDVAGFLSGDAARKRVKVEMDLDEDLPPVLADLTQLQQVVLNLMTNGMQAMEGQDQDSRYLHLSTSYHPMPGVVELRVRDNGKGVHEHDPARIFEPFHTTGANGLGIGLPICRHILDSIRGRIWVENAAAGGAIFHVTIPALSQSQKAS